MHLGENSYQNDAQGGQQSETMHWQWLQSAGTIPVGDSDADDSRCSAEGQCSWQGKTRGAETAPMGVTHECNAQAGVAKRGSARPGGSSNE
jgi:hypothetical protein